MLEQHITHDYGAYTNITTRLSRKRCPAYKYLPDLEHIFSREVVSLRKKLVALSSVFPSRIPTVKQSSGRQSEYEGITFYVWRRKEDRASALRRVRKVKFERAVPGRALGSHRRLSLFPAVAGAGARSDDHGGADAASNDVLLLCDSFAELEEGNDFLTFTAGGSQPTIRNS